MVAVGLHVGDAPRPPARIGSARERPHRAEIILAVLSTGGVLAAALVSPLIHSLLFWTLWVLFVCAVALRFTLAALVLRRGRQAAPPALRLPDAELPSYSVIVPLYKEARMAPGLLRALAALDYPRDRLEVVFALEPSDPETVAAVVDASIAAGLDIEIVLASPLEPRTKPSACNAALAHTRGRLVVIYDAEDLPHPQQLREAAERFAAAPAHLGCLQAPLRVTFAGDASPAWYKRQYALEYAALFEVVLPGFVALGVPFPLGGTSNHFRREALEQAGGWDAWNVTEDADMGLRLAALGWRLGVISLPTGETAPFRRIDWFRQRARWIKGHMQTWGVQTRDPFAGGWRRTAALPATIGLSVVSAVLHGWLDLVLLWTIGWSGFTGRVPDDAWWHGGLLLLGVLSAWSCIATGCWISERRLQAGDLLTSPLYWALQSLAALRAVWELFVSPFSWNKTPHEPYPDPPQEIVSAHGA